MTRGDQPSTESERAGRNRSPWPGIDAATTVFLLDVRDRLEADLLRDWVACHAPASRRHRGFTFVTIGHEGSNRSLSEKLESDDPVWLQPLRIAWLPGSSAPSNRWLRDLLFGRMVRPGPIRRRWLAKRRPERMAFVAGDGAWLSDLRDRRNAAGGKPASRRSLPDFITSHALITLDRAERTIRGARYKVPRIRPGEVFANEEFRLTLADVAQRRDRPAAEIRRTAARYLEEMAAAQDPFTLDLTTALYRAACRSHHDADISVIDADLDRVADALATRPVIFLISHKSMLDTMALSVVLFDRNLPLPLTFGGINLRTPGIAALARRSGIIFLRRSFQDNEIYKATFRRYIDYLIEKRFSLLWALEGTRSRTGKLLPPRFGLFNYVVESILRTKLYDVTFIPVSVAYDQITEVEDYSIEQRGRSKKPEGVAWIFRFLRRGRSRGRIHLRFGQSLTVTDIVDRPELEAGIDEREKQVLVATLAFETAVRMNAATPITATAIITLVLLAGGNRAMSLPEIRLFARTAAQLIRHRKLEIVGRADFRDDEAVRATLGELKETGIVRYLDDGNERLYAIADDQHLNAAYYRNTAIHYFVLDAIVEIALLDAASDSEDPHEAFFRRSSELREIFKFEFYFPRRANYPAETERRVRDRFSGWEQAIRKGESGVTELLASRRLLVAHGVLRSFVDAYRIVAEVLAENGEIALDDEPGFLARCLRTGRQRLRQDRVFSAESISKPLYETGLKLARYRGLLADGRATARREFHRQFCEINARLDQVLAITLAKANER